MKKDFIKELEFCLRLWQKDQGCSFWWWTKCEQCAVPYLLWKLLTWEVLHWDIKRLTLQDWKEKLKNIK